MNIWNFDANNSFSILRDNVGVELFMSLIIVNYQALQRIIYQHCQVAPLILT